MLNLAYWGSGPISNFHVPALREAGFKLVTAFSRSHSTRLDEFCFKNQIKKSKDEVSFLESIKSDCDCIMISLETSVTFENLMKVVSYGKPILCEKPGSLLSSKLEAIPKTNNLFFAYNRRFYNSVEKAKIFIENNETTNSTFFMPDSISTWHQFLINGCHIIDLMLYLYNFKLKHVGSIGSLDSKKSGFQSMFKSERNDTISFIENWGAPQNASIDISTIGKRIELRPIEKAYIYKSMKKVEPTEDYPLRQYIPEVDSCIQTNVKDFKPGFLEQSKCFYNFVQNGTPNSRMCNLMEAIDVLKTMEIIKKNLL